jgi:hypothetical protein
MPALAQIYANAIKAGTQTIDRVPLVIKAEVQKLIA